MNERWGESRDHYQPYIDLVDLPVVLAADRNQTESFNRITRRERELREWFATHAGWYLERTRELVRLIKYPVRLQEGFPVDGLREAMDYWLLALVLHTAEIAAARSGAGRALGVRFLLSNLARELTAITQERYGADALRFEEVSHRRSLIRVLKTLETLGVLHQVHTTGNWADGRGDTLYAFSESLPLLMVRPPDPELVARVVASENYPLRPLPRPDGTPEQRVWRALLLGPALLAYDDPEAFAVLVERQATIGRELVETFGWRLDLRQGTARILRDTHAQGAAGNLLSGGQSSVYGPVLLLCNRLQELVAGGRLAPDEHGCFRLGAGRLSVILGQLQDEFGNSWSTALATCSLPELENEVLPVMRSNGMLRGPDQLGDVLITPLCALYRGIAPADGKEDSGGAPAQQLRFGV